MNLLKRLGWCVILTLLFVDGYFIFQATTQEEPTPKGEIVAAFVRAKNEINTIEASLNSIDGVFDKIVIIYVDEPDDGTVAFVKKWCDKRAECFHYAYPYSVIPSHDKAYWGKYNYKNSLAAYTNFGLEKFNPEDWIVKLDADQVYMKSRMKKFVERIKKMARYNPNYAFKLWGYNTFEWQGQFVYLTKHPINGIGGDTTVAKRKNFKPYSQTSYYEVQHFQNIDKTIRYPSYLWFHFMKSIKMVGKEVRSRQTVDSADISYLSAEEQVLFETYIRPLLPDYSIYKKIRLQPQDK